VTARPAICLNMIVRNEAHIVREVLDAVAPYISSWVIVDTGSDDGTQDVIRGHMADLGIPGELHERPWRNFGHNRSEALSLAQGHGDYIWVMDADDTVVGTPDFSGLSADAYLMRLRSATNWTFWRLQLFRDGKPWRYMGVLHEYAHNDDPYVSERLDGEYYIQVRHLGGRHRYPQKYARDVDLLLAEVERNPDDARSVLYLALTYLEAGDFVNARKWALHRAGMGGWNEAVYISMYVIAESMWRLGEPWQQVQDAYLRAWKHRPTRAEPLCAIAYLHRIEQRYLLGYGFAKDAREIPLPEQDMLLVNPEVYAWRAVYEQAFCATGIGKHEEALTLCRRLLARDDIPDDERTQMAALCRTAEQRLAAEARQQRIDVAAPTTAPMTARPAICLNMIVRNEAHVVREVLDAVAPYITFWVIVDTGSDDGTQEVIRGHMAGLGIPGELHERLWRDFGHNRSEAIALAQGHGDYIWVMDADDTLVGIPDFSDLTADAYDMRLRGSGNIFWRQQLFRDGLPWRYVGAIHEYAHCDEPFTRVRLEGDYYIDDRHIGARSRDPQTNARDIELLLAEVERNPDDARLVFHLALTYLGVPDFVKARKWALHRAGMGGWDEEVYYSLNVLAESMWRLHEPWEHIQSVYLQAWKFRPTRAEPLWLIAHFYTGEKQYETGYFFAACAASIPLPQQDTLFVNSEIYAWRAVDVQAECATRIGKHEEAVTLCERLLARDDIPDDDRKRIAANRDVAARGLAGSK
jgi:glycosyltransferase involved in cell wall biosynthesis